MTENPELGQLRKFGIGPITDIRIGPITEIWNWADYGNPELGRLQKKFSKWKAGIGPITEEIF